FFIMQNVVVTFDTDKEQRQVVESLIKKSDIKYLKDYDEHQYGDVLKNADALLSWNPSREFKSHSITLNNKIKFVQLLSAGSDHINLKMFPAGCKVAANNGAYSEPMAEHIMAMVLALAKRLFINHQHLADGEFNQKGINISIKNSVFGILGYGGIGKALANLIRPFGSKILAINFSGRTTDTVDFIGTLNNLNHVLKNSNIIIISLPLSDETEGLISKNELSLMRPDAILINAARGKIINEADLYEHLRTHSDFYAGIDAWWSEPFTEGEFKLNYPFFELPNIIGSPHNSAVVPGSLLEGIKSAIENLNRFLNNNEPENIINKI
ncbi:MAG TPA: 2-hydroxyacid dehydrogenase, partial [Ignavibacteriaceae bacterium]|nr:2-hydroxyacid dehydrogenase [Ignavibacteriaceae bacterium]